MKKVVLGTTALIGAAALATGAIAGGAPANAGAAKSGLNVTVGGHIDFQAGFADQEEAFETGANSRDVKFQNDTEIHVKVEGRADNGLKYGAVIELEADISNDADTDGTNADKTFLFVESGFGRVEFGGNSGAAEALEVDASNIAVATGGIDGDWYDFANTTGSFIISPNHVAAHNNGVAADATKITYYTPRFSGFQGGISFTPDLGDGGTAAGFTGDLSGNFEDVFDLAVNYTGQVNQVGVEASLTALFGDAENAGAEDLESYQAGVALSYMGFSFAGSYGDWQETGFATGTANDDADFWTLGAAYQTGPFAVSVTYLNSEYGANDFDNISVGADYQLAPGFVPYVEVSFFDLDQAGTVSDNDGSVVLVGAELSF